MTANTRIGCLVVCAIAAFAFSSLPIIGWLWEFGGLLAALYCMIEVQDEIEFEKTIARANEVLDRLEGKKKP